MIRSPPRSTRTDTLFPYTTLCRSFSRHCNALADALSAVRMHVEAAIDFPDEEIDFLSDRALRTRLDAVQQQMRTLLHEARRSEERRVGKEGVSTCRSRCSTYH